MTRVMAAILAMSLGGCGLLQTRGPDPRQPPDQRPSCTESFDAPKRDAIGAGLGFGAILIGLLFLKAGDNETVGVPLIVGGAVLTVASYASGGIGYYRVKNCRKKIADHERAHPGPGVPPTAPAH